MFFPTRTAWCLIPALLLACGNSDPKEPPAVSLTPPGPVMATGPVHFQATIANGNGDVTWTLSGPGKLSAATGQNVVWLPPAMTSSENAMVTATALGASASAMISYVPPSIGATVIPGLSAP